MGLAEKFVRVPPQGAKRQPALPVVKFGHGRDPQGRSCGVALCLKQPFEPVEPLLNGGRPVFRGDGVGGVRGVDHGDGLGLVEKAGGAAGAGQTRDGMGIISAQVSNGP